MNLRILKSILIIITILTLVGGATVAYFTDTETSTGNTFTAGTFDLKVADNNEDYGDGVHETWTMKNMIPGVTTCGGMVLLKNFGSIEADHVEIEVSNDCIEAGNEESDTLPKSAEGMDEYIQITHMEYYGRLLLFTDTDDPDADDDDPATPWNEVDDVNGNGFIDLDDFEQKPIDDLKPVPTPDIGRCFIMYLKFHKSAPNDYQGDKCDMTMTFTLNQHSSQ
ncbi:MAG: TasA family protein [Actinomycetota bacterium]|nr:TasA family protein [Actinomycetota bacterium]MDI6822440.1 TasA family protein [Actinomycetota bacterium]